MTFKHINFRSQFARLGRRGVRGSIPVFAEINCDLQNTCLNEFSPAKSGGMVHDSHNIFAFGREEIIFGAKMSQQLCEGSENIWFS